MIDGKLKFLLARIAPGLTPVSWVAELRDGVAMYPIGPRVPLMDTRTYSSGPFWGRFSPRSTSCVVNWAATGSAQTSRHIATDFALLAELRSRLARVRFILWPPVLFQGDKRNGTQTDAVCARWLPQNPSCIRCEQMIQIKHFGLPNFVKFITSRRLCSPKLQVFRNCFSWRLRAWPSQDFAREVLSRIRKRLFIPVQFSGFTGSPRTETTADPPRTGASGHRACRFSP